MFQFKKTTDDYEDLLIIFMKDKLEENNWQQNKPEFNFALISEDNDEQKNQDHNHIIEFKKKYKIKSDNILKQILISAENSKYIKESNSFFEQNPSMYALTDNGYQRVITIKEQNKNKKEKIQWYFINILLTTIVTIFVSYITYIINTNDDQKKIKNIEKYSKQINKDR
jgi:hypothetical protein